MSSQLAMDNAISLNGAKDNQDETKDIKQASEQIGASVMRGDYARNCKGWMVLHKFGLQRVVYPFANRDQDSSCRKFYHCKVANYFNVDGQTKYQKNREKYEHSLVPVVNFQIRQRIIYHPGLLSGFFILVLYVIGIHSVYRE